MGFSHHGRAILGVIWILHLLGVTIASLVEGLVPRGSGVWRSRVLLFAQELVHMSAERLTSLVTFEAFVVHANYVSAGGTDFACASLGLETFGGGTSVLGYELFLEGPLIGE